MTKPQVPVFKVLSLKTDSEHPIVRAVKLLKPAVGDALKLGGIDAVGSALLTHVKILGEALPHYRQGLIMALRHTADVMEAEHRAAAPTPPLQKGH